VHQLTHPTIAWLAIFLVALCAESWFSWRFLRRLEKEYPRLWRRSGKRTIWTDTDLISARPTIQYLWKRKYAHKAKESEKAFCESYRLPVVLSWAAAGLSALAFFVSILTAGWPKG
jgi:hypothetical protein